MDEKNSSLGIWAVRIGAAALLSIAIGLGGWNLAESIALGKDMSGMKSANVTVREALATHKEWDAQLAAINSKLMAIQTDVAYLKGLAKGPPPGKGQ